ncbi:hypothetical protein DPSP01_002086 [Paraphaeosphaeria sporulosa]|uniref:Uncharacterized protein n=1 Tax=Paraphaeosphaeria sporulosa TaxID=1460663 RepID=A0A177CZR4_9PLEO|nr:uncharacterized protein CC84DRAFT_123358 [Paraphaeosphaeria sporulosa]OAG12457.1 hypothetical protein CC84DRAFT_123358 [Paraphaeosphaeria sporulosa]
MRLKTLNGAPLRASLDFTPDALLDPHEVARFLRSDSFLTELLQESPFNWRRIAPREQRLRSDWSQPYLPSGGLNGDDLPLSFVVPGVGASFDAYPEDATNLETMMTVDGTSFDDSRFVHHSLIFHDTLLSSQIALGGLADGTGTSQSFVGTSFESATSMSMGSFQQSNTDVPVIQIPATLKLTSFGALPSAAHLRRIYPQTPTPNFLCVLAAPPEDREVFVKKGGYRMRLREIVVADDTRSDFKITFWQRPKGDDSQNPHTHVLQRTKPGDILLLKNIALNAFREDVYGQSLNPSIARVQTSIEILMSSGGISSRQLAALPAPVVTAFMRVKKWASAHVASDVSGRKKRKDDSRRSTRSVKRYLRSSDVHDETLPPDTMESV